MQSSVCRLAALGVFCLPLSLFAQQRGTVHGRDGITLPPPPVAAVEPVTNNYFGTNVVDNYRWLEDAKSAQTLKWIVEENNYTQDYLSQLKILPQIRKQLTDLERVDEYSVPILRNGKYFFDKRLANENQASIYMRDGWSGEDVRLIDATKMSPDQDTSVHIWDLSNDGGLLIYAVRQGGADEAVLHFLNVKDRTDLPDVLPSARYFGASLSPDGKGVYYSKFTHDGTTVWFHQFGTPVSADKKIFGGEYKGQKLGELALIDAFVTDNHRYLMIHIGHGVPATEDDILVKDLRKPDSQLIPLVYGVKAHTGAINVGDRFLLQTDFDAPNGRIVLAVPGAGGPEAWKTVVPEGKDVIASANVVGGKLFVSRLHDVKTETTIYSLDGKKIGMLTYPGIGTGSIVYGRSMDKVGFYTFESFITPPSIYRYDTRTGKTETFFTPKVPFDSSQYEVHQVFYTSKDGTRVPMFIAGKKGLAQDGKAKLLMTGYGGFDLPMLPEWNPEYAWWMEQGGFFALPDMRGGNEYGEAWHKAAMFGNKQNVFDDFYGAAEYLIKNKYTTPERFAIRGRSNGGLLMGAAMTQRPDLFGAIWCGYPLLDMLRYQYFEFGRLWTTEYGSSQNPKDFAYLLKYSPYQNVHIGTKYPAIMFFTGSNDTRVDPMNARKMTALMQSSTGNDRPILLHYSLKGGHSSGVSLHQLVEDQTDELGFLWTETDWPSGQN
ncbi:MAG TPA: prolyl oligopeptidase family serine peptidase [Acidobacteriaceae bacterium]|nr:prolyl oligopeptidase family serine peptidase [Acidobacteriaceae bacterium]